VFPLDTLNLLETERQEPINGEGDRNGVIQTGMLDWTTRWAALKAEVAEHGMRNSNLLAIAPTATISSIAGCSPSIEPTYKNLYVVSNLSGEFIVLNEALVRDMERRGLWTPGMAEAVKADDGDLRRISGVPEDLKQKYPEAFAIEQSWLILAAAARGKWID